MERARPPKLEQWKTDNEKARVIGIIGIMEIIRILGAGRPGPRRVGGMAGAGPFQSYQSFRPPGGTIEAAGTIRRSGTAKTRETEN